MLRVIFDTNIYGDLFNEKDFDTLQKRIKEDHEFVVYGYNPIRQEIRNIPKVTKLSKKARIALLTLYDTITNGHFLEHSLRITNLAKKYYNYYREQGGTYGWDTNISIDLTIVACASFHGLDIVYSGDNKTLGGKAARKAYRHVNIRESLRTPDLLTYQELLMKLRNQL